MGASPPLGIGRAAGGPVKAGRWNLIGERGPELVRWGSDGQVFSHDHSLGLLAGQSTLSRALGGVAQAIAGLAAEIARLRNLLARASPRAGAGASAAGGLPHMPSMF